MALVRRLGTSARSWVWKSLKARVEWNMKGRLAVWLPVPGFPSLVRSRPAKSVTLVVAWVRIPPPAPVMIVTAYSGFSWITVVVIFVFRVGGLS